MIVNLHSSLPYLFLIVNVQAKIKTTLYDLNIDPYETENVLDEPAYSDILVQINSRVDYWWKLAAPSQIPDDSNKDEMWKNRGGVGPWLEDGDIIKPSVEKRVALPGTDFPNIVFVMLDDWGWNDLGMRSTYLSWTTPNIDRIASEGISLTNYFTHSTCIPSRGAFLTGKYPFRLGLSNFDETELPIAETTIAEHLQSLGYRTNLVGKWHMGFSSSALLPTNRGFDYFYGYHSDYIDQWTKSANGKELYLDLQEGTSLVNSATEIDNNMHAGYLMQSKVEKVIADHVTFYEDQPLFLFYSMPLMGGSWQAPQEFLARCAYPRNEYIQDDVIANHEYNYCGLNVMIDEAIANLTCAIESYGLANNTVMIIVSDNGGSEDVIGNNYPYQGSKGDHYRGGVSSTAIIHSKLVPEERRGKTFDGLMHVTDWLPTLMGLISENNWAPDDPSDLDGINMWDALMENQESPRTEIVHFLEKDEISLQLGMVKFDQTTGSVKAHKPEYDFGFDLKPEHAKFSCVMPSLVYDVYTTKAKNKFMYDLDLDPLEESSVIDTPAYKDAFSILLDRADYWSNFIRHPEIPDDVLKSKWRDCAGVCSWLDTDEENSLVTVPAAPTQKYSYDNAPNIVFVLVDDWGWNDIGYHSTYMNWATPTIDRLAGEGIKLENYYTEKSCIPARGALLTGKYSFKLGLWLSGEGAELPLNETTLAEELQSAGYRTYMVGKWHLGFSSQMHQPTRRGFDSFYGYLNGAVDYWTKSYGSFLDLHENDQLVTNKKETDPELHNGYLMQMKAEAAIAEHAENYADQPMFLYYAMQLIHGVWSAPEAYVERCGVPETIANDYLQTVESQYCALNLMLDETVANLTCALESNGMAENTIFIMVSDNGGEGTVPGNNFPFRGSKGSYWRGGVSAAGFIHSNLIPEDSRGTSYFGQMHVTDWMPTIMGLATDGAWEPSSDQDGEDMWTAVVNNEESPRLEIVHYHDGSSFSLQLDMMKLDHGNNEPDFDIPEYEFAGDLKPPTVTVATCEDPTLLAFGSKRPSTPMTRSKTSTDKTVTSDSSDSDSDEFYRAAMVGGGAALLVAAVMLFVFSRSDSFMFGDKNKFDAVSAGGDVSSSVEREELRHLTGADNI